MKKLVLYPQVVIVILYVLFFISCNTTPVLPAEEFSSPEISLITPVDDAIDQELEVLLTWQATPGNSVLSAKRSTTTITGYSVYFAQESASYGIPVSYTGKNLNKSSLSASTVYKWKVTVHQQDGKSTTSGEYRFTTKEATPLGEFQVFPPDNPWNKDISKLPIHPDSDIFIDSIGSETEIHPDFGTVWAGAPNGIPFVFVGNGQPFVPILYTAYGNESDPGPFPIPDDAPIEGGPTSSADRHVLVVDIDNHWLYELYKAYRTATGWEAESGAKWNLDSNDVRTKYWTSADAAGLPIFPGLVRYDEVESGAILHALRFTVPETQKGFIFPARHFASSSEDAALPPMGLRFRLKAGIDISEFPTRVQVILQALKTYGMIVADNGGTWFISGAPDMRWDDEELASIRQIKGSDFEAVYTGEIEY